jgi:hypothetical protein
MHGRKLPAPDPLRRIADRLVPFTLALAGAAKARSAVAPATLKKQ